MGPGGIAVVIYEVFVVYLMGSMSVDMISKECYLYFLCKQKSCKI